MKDESRISWSGGLKSSLQRCQKIKFEDEHIRVAQYRPFTSKCLYFDPALNERRYLMPQFFGSGKMRLPNTLICVTAPGNTKDFHCLVVTKIPDIHLTGDSQCFGFYRYDKHSGNRLDNVTDCAVKRFRLHYGLEKISKWDVFCYVYGVLHSPDYRSLYSANLKRELPRIPFLSEFGRFAEAGRKLVTLHTEYEQADEFPLEMIENPAQRLNWRVSNKMRLSKDRRVLFYNDFLCLSGIPEETYKYRLGNRSAIDWVISEYQVVTDKRSGLLDDPNKEDASVYIVSLIKKIVTISLKTQEIVNSLPNFKKPVKRQTVPVKKLANLHAG